MRVGFTGTHRGMTDQQQFKLSLMLAHLDISELHHGDCIGSDAEAHKIAIKSHLTIIIHPPEDDMERAFCQPGWGTVVLPPRPYMRRNQDIVSACDLLIAMPKQQRERYRSVTWAMIRFARKTGKQVVIVNPSDS